MRLTPTLVAILCTATLLAQDPQPADRPPVSPVPPAPGLPGATPAADTPGAAPAPAPVPAPPKPSATGRSTTRKRVELLAAEAANGGTALALTDANLERATQLLEDVAVLPRTTKTGRTLVVQSTEQDPSALANAEEDLSVMALILRKATGVTRTEERRVAMGIEVDTSVFGSSSGARNMYIEGYGALFLLAVRYPLIAPTENAGEKEPKQSVSNDWADAREEYLGANQARFQIALEPLRAARLAREQYEPEKVEELKTALLQALKNASHVRVLKPTDFITIVIQGAEGNRPEKAAPRAGSSARNRNDTRSAETVMTIRVKASDMNAFAKTELDLEGFRRRAVIQTYFRRADSAVGTAGFIAPPAPGAQ